MARVLSYQDLIVWQKGMDLAVEVYRLTRQMPKTEEYRLISQIIRSSSSVPANIAEGHSRSSRADYARFVSIARGSLAETETFLILAIRTELLKPDNVVYARQLCTEVGKMLTSLHKRLRC